MTSDRKTHVISRMLSYLFNSDMSDEQLFDVLHNRVGMSKEERMSSVSTALTTFSTWRIRSYNCVIR